MALTCCFRCDKTYGETLEKCPHCGFYNVYCDEQLKAQNPARTQTEEIRKRAHELWLMEGKPNGRAKEHWAMAEKEWKWKNSVSRLIFQSVAAIFVVSSLIGLCLWWALK